MKDSEISIAMCTYNGAKYLQQQLESLLSQTRLPDEIIICDDSSTDETAAIVARFQSTMPQIIKFFQNARQLGARKNFEKAIGLCHGDIIFLCDQDDVWSPDKIAITVSFFKDHPEYDAVFTNGNLLTANGKLLSLTMWDSLGFGKDVRNKITAGELLEYILLNGNIVTGTSLAFRRSSLPFILPVHQPYDIWHDHWIALQLAAQGRLFFRDDCLLGYRIHDQQQVGFQMKLPDDQLPAVLWQSTDFDEDQDGSKTLTVLHGLYLLEQVAALSVSFQGSLGAENTRKKLLNRLDDLKTKWLRSSMPFLPRKKRLLKHWLSGGEYLRIKFVDIVRI